MYTWEIENLLKLKNYILSGKEYIHIVNTSPQIKQIKYNAYNDTFEAWTKEDDNSVNYMKYKVRKR